MQSMYNSNLEIGNRYLWSTLYRGDRHPPRNTGKEGAPDEPLKFKLYRGVDHQPLSQSFPLVLGEICGPVEGAEGASEPELGSSTLDEETLSALLYYTYGLSRQDEGPGVSWPLHRFVPSARCLFPTELYLWIPEGDRVPSGIYHYDTLHHRLAAVRPGHHREALERVVGAELGTPRLVLLFSSLFWKNAFRYRDYAYRLCTQEAGMVVGNALMVGDALGLRGHVRYQFLDRPANRLMGFDPIEESLFAVVPMYDRNSKILDTSCRISEPDSAERLLEDIESVAPRYLKVSSLDPELCGLVAEIDQNSFMEHTEEFSVLPRETPGDQVVCESDGLTEAMPAASDGVPPQRKELAAALRHRNSGDDFKHSFQPLPKPIAGEAFSDIVRHAAGRYAYDLQESGLGPMMRLYAAVNNVEGVPEGVYRYCARCDALHVVSRGRVSLALQRAVRGPQIINYSFVGAAFYLVGDYPGASAALGNRAYRILNMEGGIMAQRVCVMSAAHGLAARVSNNYYQVRSEALLGLTGTPWVPIFHLVVGHQRPGTQYQFSIT